VAAARARRADRALAALRGVVGVDSGLSHIAVALDLPHVQIYNFDTAWRTGPLGRRASAASSPSRRLRRRGLARLAHVTMRRMIRPLYSLMLIGAQPLLRRKLRRRGVAEPGYLEHVASASAATTAHRPGRLWIHAVSLARRARPRSCIDALRSCGPTLRILLTHGTATGRAEGVGCCAKAMRRPGCRGTRRGRDALPEPLPPAAGVLMETEVWPNMARSAGPRHAAGAGQRAPEREVAAQARAPAAPVAPAYGALAAAWAQTEATPPAGAAPAPRVQGVFGNLKFDADARRGAAGAGPPGAGAGPARW
jgi:3-deoxy-D-manno-octulosonic-acid transferase